MAFWSPCSFCDRITELSNFNNEPDYTSIDVNKDKSKAWIQTNYDLGNNVK